MRRTDREITDEGKIKDIIDRCTCCRIGFNDNGKVYIVPLNFGYLKNENNYIFYFHGAIEGRKINLIKTAPNVGFEMDTNHKLQEAESACAYSASFESIIGNGVVHLVTEVEEKNLGLSLIMEHNTGKKDWIFDGKMVNVTAVFKLEVTELSCKVKQ